MAVNTSYGTLFIAIGVTIFGEVYTTELSTELA